MERETYRLNLERVTADFPDQTMIYITDAARYLKVNIRTLQADQSFIKLCKNIGKKTVVISCENLAYWKSGG